MREIKVQCDCGQKYKFEVEPIHGQMPYAVACPVCGLDGTRKANLLLSAPPVPPAPIVVSAVSALPAEPVAQPGVTIASPPAPPPPPAPAPARIVLSPQPSAAQPPHPPVEAAAAASAPVAAASEKPKLRISATAHAPAASSAPAAPEAGSGPAAPVPRARPIGNFGKKPAPAVESSGRKPSFALGLLGAFVGALIGGAIYYAVFSLTGSQIGLVGIGVGFLGGLGARVLGKEGSNELGVITATLTLVAILGAQYFVAWKWWHEDSEETSATEFQEMVEEARRVVKAVPTGSDQEIRLFLAKEYQEEVEEKINPSLVTAEEIEEFRKELPQMRELADGKLTREMWEQRQKAEEERMQAALTEEEKEEDERTFKFFFMLLLLNKVNLVSMCAGAGLAYKMSTDAPG